jgi:hypothetical protein
MAFIPFLIGATVMAGGFGIHNEVNKRGKEEKNLQNAYSWLSNEDNFKLFAGDKGYLTDQDLQKARDSQIGGSVEGTDLYKAFQQILDDRGTIARAAELRGTETQELAFSNGISLQDFQAASEEVAKGRQNYFAFRDDTAKEFKQNERFMGMLQKYAPGLGDKIGTAEPQSSDEADDGASDTGQRISLTSDGRVAFSSPSRLANVSGASYDAGIGSGGLVDPYHSGSQQLGDNRFRSWSPGSKDNTVLANATDASSEEAAGASSTQSTAEAAGDRTTGYRWPKPQELTNLALSSLQDANSPLKQQMAMGNGRINVGLTTPTDAATLQSAKMEGNLFGQDVVFKDGRRVLAETDGQITYVDLAQGDQVLQSSLFAAKDGLEYEGKTYKRGDRLAFFKPQAAQANQTAPSSPATTRPQATPAESTQANVASSTNAEACKPVTWTPAEGYRQAGKPYTPPASGATNRAASRPAAGDGSAENTQATGASGSRTRNNQGAGTSPQA